MYDFAAGVHQYFDPEIVDNQNKNLDLKPIENDNKDMEILEAATVNSIQITNVNTALPSAGYIIAGKKQKTKKTKKTKKNNKKNKRNTKKRRKTRRTKKRLR